MPVKLHTLKVSVRSNESDGDLVQHVGLALSGSMGIEEVVSVEPANEPPVPEVQAKKEDQDDGEGSRDGGDGKSDPAAEEVHS